MSHFKGMLNLCKDYVKFLYKTLTILFETTFNQCNYWLIKRKNKECSNNIEEAMNKSELQTR